MSWNGTVRCGNCYEPGHNITGCPELKKAWEQDPTSYDGRRWQIFLDRKTRPKKCGYCDEDGHTRAGCGDLKAHKSLFVEDLVLWRHALVKWTKDTHLGIGALVRCTDASYYQDDVYMYPGEDNYEPALGMILYPINPALSHYSGIVNTNEWNNSNHSLFSFERLGADASLPEYRKTVGVTLPCIPGIVPRMGKGWYGKAYDRHDRLNNVQWQVVSPAPAAIQNDVLLSSRAIKKTAKVHFAAPQEETVTSFHTFGDFQRKQLHQYINGEIELSQMKDPELPQTDS
tara:strand:- start:115 stop:972 length:858 start_codon:yes stop_codon:yes gene_type:complete